MPQPGWYPAPNDPTKLSFWDGVQWTGQTMDKPSGALPSDQPLSRRALREQRGEGVAMAFPIWDNRQETPERLPAPESAIEAGAETGGFELGDGAVVEPVDPQEMPVPYVFDNPVPEPADDLYAALQVTPEELEQSEATQPQGWMSDAQAVYTAPETPQYPVATEGPQYPTVAAPVPTEAPQYPTSMEPIPTVEEPVASELLPVASEPLPEASEPVPSVWGSAPAAEPDSATTDDDFDAALGVTPEPKRPWRTKREKSAPRSTQPMLERNREPAPSEPVAIPKAVKSGRLLEAVKTLGVRSGLITAVAGLVVALGALTAVPAVLDPVPAGGAVQSGEQRATAQVRELNVDIDGYCHPTVEVPTGLGSFEVLGLKLHELNTACPVKVGESVTVYYEPNSGGEARYVRAGEVPVDTIMWSLFGLGMLAAAWGSLRVWTIWKGVRVPMVTPKAEAPATLV